MTIPSAPSQGTLLLIDDIPANLKILMDLLQRTGFKVLVARDGEEGLSIARQALPELILLDVMMPGMDGFEVCHLLKADSSTSAIPVIFMTALNDLEHKINGFRAGGNDYITKPFQQEEVLARIETQLSLYRMQQQVSVLNASLRDKNQLLAEQNQQLQRQNEMLQSLVGVLERAKQTAEGEVLAKTELLAGLSQELRVPMQAVLGTSETLQAQAAHLSPELTMEKLNVVTQSSKRLLSILNDLLDFSRLETRQLRLFPEHFAIETLLTELRQELTQDAPMQTGDNTYLIEAADNTGEILADPGRVRQMLENVLINAARFTTQGQIQLRAERVWKADREWIHFIVADNGIGLTPEQQAKIYHPFLCGIIAPPGSYQGTGMELCLARRLAEAMHGTINLYSTPGQGTTVNIHLPTISPEAELEA